MIHRWAFLLKGACLWHDPLRKEEDSVSGSLGLIGYLFLALGVLFSSTKMKAAFELQWVGRAGGSWLTYYCFSRGDVYTVGHFNREMLNEESRLFTSFWWMDVRFVKTPPSWNHALGIKKECLLMTG